MCLEQHLLEQSLEDCLTPSIGWADPHWELVQVLVELSALKLLRMHRATAELLV